MVRLVRHRQTKGPETDRLYLNHRATSRLYPFFWHTAKAAPTHVPVGWISLCQNSFAGRFLGHPAKRMFFGIPTALNE
jgi:hypothetical protein